MQPRTMFETMGSFPVEVGRGPHGSVYVCMTIHETYPCRVKGMTHVCGFYAHAGGTVGERVWRHPSQPNAFTVYRPGQ